MNDKWEQWPPIEGDNSNPANGLIVWISVIVLVTVLIVSCV